jgi:hypothetical protein
MLCDRLGREILPGSVVMQVWSGSVFVVSHNQIGVSRDMVGIRKLDVFSGMWMYDFIRIDPREWARHTEVVGNVR